MREITLLDGSIGQELVLRSQKKPTPLWSTEVLLENPKLVHEIHSEYFRAGSTIATTNTYPVLRDRLEKVGLAHKLEALWESAIKSALDSRNAHGKGRVAGSIGPLVGSYRPESCPSAEVAEESYAEIVNALAPSVDLILLETMSSVSQAEGALRASIKSGLPVWLAVTVDDFNGKVLRSGEDLNELRPLLEAFTPDALLINCSRPEAVSTAVEKIKNFGFPFGAYANGFEKISRDFVETSPTVDKLDQRNDLDEKKYAGFAMSWIENGASIVGGCCEIGPSHIIELRNSISAKGFEIV